MISQSKKAIISIISIAVIMSVAAAIRFSTLDQREFWYDEAFSGVLIQLPWQSMFDVIRDDVHPFTYYSLLKIWVGVFGISDFSIRSFSAVCGILLIPVSVLFMRELLPEKRNWGQYIPAVLFTFSPFFIAYSQEARTYAFIGVLMLLAATFFFRALRRSPLAWNRDWFFFSLCIGFSFVSHYVTGFGIITFYGFLWWYAQTHDFLQTSHRRAFFKTQIAALLPAAIIFLVWLPSLIYQLRHGGNLGWIPRAEFSFLPRSIYAFLFGVDAHALGVPPVNPFPSFIGTDSIAFLLFVGLLFLWLFVYSRIKTLPRQKDALLYITSISIVPILLVIIASLFGIHLYVERYLTGYAAAVIMLISVLLAQLSKKVLTMTLAIYIVLTFLVQQPIHNPGYRAVADAVRTRYADRRIIMIEPLNFLMMRYYSETNSSLRVELYNPDNKDHFDSWPLFDSKPIVEAVRDMSKTSVVISSGALDGSLTEVFTAQEQLGDFIIYTYK